MLPECFENSDPAVRHRPNANEAAPCRRVQPDVRPSAEPGQVANRTLAGATIVG